MGLDMTLYHEADKDIVDIEDISSMRVPYWRNERELDSLFRRYSFYKDEDKGEFHLNRKSILKILNDILPSVMDVYVNAITTYKKIEDINLLETENENMTQEKLNREYYVVGRIFLDKIYNQLKESDFPYDCFSLLNDDEKGEGIKKVILSLVTLGCRLKDDEKLIYISSF